jgi:hypothetical protein
LTEAELLQRIAETLRQDIGPAVDAEYPRTQAFMAAVVLQKLSRQLALAGEHAAAEAADLTELLADLRAMLGDETAPAAVRTADDGQAETRENAALCRLIEAHNESRVLGRIRQTMRRSVDRRMAVAG